MPGMEMVQTSAMNSTELPRILIVDDKEENLFVLALLLKPLKCEVIQASSGAEALEKYRKNIFSCILLDVQMPGMSGFELASKIQDETDSATPIIFISAAYQENTAILEGYECGAIDYLLKPINPPILLAKVKMFLQLAEEKRRNALLLLEQKKLFDDIEQLALIDPLTNIYNRRQFLCFAEKIKHSAKRFNEQFALMHIDVDGFKQINDTYGHDIGDAVLIEITKRLKNAIRETEVLARLGGDEFAMLVTRFGDMDNIVHIAKKMIESINAPNQIPNTSIAVSISIGIACYPFAGNSLNEVFKKADIALYHAKKQGKNNFQFFSTELNEKYQKKAAIEELISHALSNNEFHIGYQPFVQLETKQVIGFEALLRWKSKTLGNLLPRDFIDVAEQTKEIIKIGRWMRPVIFEQYNQWKQTCKFDEFYLALNVSETELLLPSFSDELLQLIEYHAIPHELVMIELSEKIFDSHAIEVSNNIDSLRKKKINISIDNFGMGYSSLSQLCQHPVNLLNINKMFVKNMETDSKNGSMIKLILALAQTLSLNVIAKGIETQQQHELLMSSHCTYGQGLHYSDILCAKDFTQYLITGINNASPNA